MIGFIGAGKMTQALAGGFVAAGLTSPEKIWASAPSDRNLQYMEKDGYIVTHDNAAVVNSCSLIFIAVKPHLALDVVNSIRPDIITDKHVIVSVMSGITLATLEEYLPLKTRIIRMMPNTPVLVRNGVTVFTKGTYATQNDGEILCKLMNSVGICEEVPERMINMCTGLTGSGPAYVYMMIQAMADGAVKMGLPRDLATNFASHTFAGAAKMVLESGKHPAVLQDEVASPGGTTIHGLHQLEVGGLRGNIINAVEAATVRADELTKTLT